MTELKWRLLPPYSYYPMGQICVGTYWVTVPVRVLEECRKAGMLEKEPTAL